MWCSALDAASRACALLRGRERIESEENHMIEEKNSHMIISALLFTWQSCRMTEVGTRRSSLSTMAFTSVLLFICSIYSCYAQVPLLMWTSDGYVTRLSLEYCFQINFYSNSRTLLCFSYICSAKPANSDIQKRLVEVHYSGQGFKSAWFCWGGSWTEWYLCQYRSNMPHLAQPAAGQTVSDGQLASYLKSALSTAPHNVLLFLQDKVKCIILLLFAI